MPEIVTAGKIRPTTVALMAGFTFAMTAKAPKELFPYDRIGAALLFEKIYTMTAGLGGTISGEHGIGHKRTKYLGLVMGKAHLDLMRKIKTTFDPNNILNPGKGI